MRCMVALEDMGGWGGKADDGERRTRVESVKLVQIWIEVERWAIDSV